MQRYMHTFIMLMLIIISSARAMENNGVLVRTSDNKDCRLPQWKIEASRVLQIKQGLQRLEKRSGALLAPIILKTINQKQLQLFSGALDTHYFPYFVDKKLTSDERKLLFCVAGPQGLDSPYIMYQFLKKYCPQDIIKNNINLYLPTIEIGHYLQGLIIADNCKYKNFTHTRSENYTEDVVYNYDGSYCRLPQILLPKPRFNGTAFPLIEALSDESDERWYIEKIKKIDQEKGYVLTPMEPADDEDLLRQMSSKENKKRLWVKHHKNDKVIQKIIEHTQVIEHSVFSSDGKYLATSSVGEHGELILTDLTIENNKFSGSDIVLTGHSGLINCICFNKQSTMLAAVSKKNVYVWDMKTLALRAVLECPEGKTYLMRFCNKDTQLITITFDETTNNSYMRLWDRIGCNHNDFYSIDINLGVDIKSYVTRLIGFPSEDKIILKTKQGAMIFDPLNKSIMDIKTINNSINDSFSCVATVLMPHQPILMAMAKNDKKFTVDLWDINSKKQIVTLLEDEKHFVGGVGVDATGRYVVTTIFSPISASSMVTTALYDDKAADCLNWIKTEPTLLQIYLLYRLYVARKNNDSVFLHPDSPEYRIFQDLSNEPCNIKEIVEKYL